MAWRIALALCTLAVCARQVCAQSPTPTPTPISMEFNETGLNGTDIDGSGSGSSNGSASTSGGSADCASTGCSHDCTDTVMGPVCICPVGYELGNDGVTCQPCPSGYWGNDCANLCEDTCGQGNPCDHRDGTCECNSCWNGLNCTDAIDYQCFLDFLQIIDKTRLVLNQEFGAAYFPVPPTDTLTDLVVTDLLEAPASVVSDVNLETVDRANVSQGPLAKLTFTVDYRVNRPEAEAGLARLENKVKVGTIRATLIIQSLQDTADVTVNAGTSND